MIANINHISKGYSLYQTNGSENLLIRNIKILNFWLKIYTKMKKKYYNFYEILHGLETRCLLKKYFCFAHLILPRSCKILFLNSSWLYNKTNVTGHRVDRFYNSWNTNGKIKTNDGILIFLISKFIHNE